MEHVYDETELRRLMTGFLDRSLPVAQWRHDAHCLVTACLLRLRPDMELARELPDLIRAYNVATGGINSDTSGYHHTITLTYLHAIRAFLATQGDDLAQACAQMMASPIGDKAFPLTYFSRDRLFSTEARLGWVEPDLKPLDGIF